MPYSEETRPVTSVNVSPELGIDEREILDGGIGAIVDGQWDGPVVLVALAGCSSIPGLHIAIDTALNPSSA